ncbi:hypothetical protein [Flavobacterium sp.]|uniref:hypothetical protein n=1 Tax=Flavobacterium sp. TaxID=239 RepID=UPI00261CC016|nr:hypothetical protein [Flavobacterium sp.]
MDPFFKLLTIVLFFSSSLFAQEAALIQYKSEMIAYMAFDQKYPTPNAAQKKQKDSLFQQMEQSFQSFVRHKDSHQKAKLKGNLALQNRGITYSDLGRYFYDDPLERQQRDIHLMFYGVYDYKLPDFVSVYIQIFTLEKETYAIYYRKLNGKGTYYVKDINSNTICFTSDAFTPERPILALHALDAQHLLFIESMHRQGHRAYVIKKGKTNFQPIRAFEGKTWANPTTPITKSTPMVFQSQRQYLYIAGNENLINSYEFRPLLFFEPKTKTLTYTINQEGKKVTASWSKQRYKIDDFFLGQYKDDRAMPRL